MKTKPFSWMAAGIIAAFLMVIGEAQAANTYSGGLSNRFYKWNRPVIVTTLGLTQIMAWGSSYYLPAVIGPAVSAQTGWPFPWVIGSLSLGLLVAGLISPHVGAAIERHGGRMTLAFSAVCLGIGQLVLAASPTLAVFVAGWLIMGFGMGAGLYDAAFSTLGRLYGRNARSTITSLTLFGGFASTVCWPISAFLLDAFGWRGVCLVYAALQLVVALPAYLLILPRGVPAEASAQTTVAPERAWHRAACR